ncbi:unnamed protein product [Caenorhabditis auriculariae]|uniref:TBC1 domain family member 13 n=1 Tax=Caenorhabditis auriculariae TaxID=2777116 RepID=A0A8S1H1T0_9PELO|nr:unnamed protein product [Caenorhabditis auriculariae]
MSSRYLERLAKIEQVLLIENKKIDIAELRAGCSYGVPEQLRPLAWRLLLNFLPLERHKWVSHSMQQRKNYDLLVEQFVVGDKSAAVQNDHPLSDSPASDWNVYFQDNRILAQIDKDVRRLYPEIQFFQIFTKFPHREAVKFPLSRRVVGSELETQVYGTDRFGALSCVQKAKSPLPEEQSEENTSELHWQVVERILFIFAKLNPGVQYVQGMNELIAPIYYVFASDSDLEWAAHAEADTFFCFQQLMSEVKDNFIKTLDNSICGIESMMSSFHAMLASFDNQLHQHLTERLSIKPQFYAFRWFTLLLSQEFPLPDVITLWDSLFSDSNRFSLLSFVCLAMLELQRDHLLCGDFAECVRLLQNYPAYDVAAIVCLAREIMEGKAVKPSKEISKTGKIGHHLYLTLALLSLVQATEYGPMSDNFVDYLSRSPVQNAYALNQIKQYGSTGSFGGKTFPGDEPEKMPVLFIHGNSDSALKFGSGLFSSGWNNQIRYFTARGYKLSELYGITYGDRNITNSYLRRFNCEDLMGHRKFLEAILGYTGFSKINIIAHSMGVSIARKIIRGGMLRTDNGTCDLGPSISQNVKTLLGISGANYGMCACQNASQLPACGKKLGFFPGSCEGLDCLSDKPCHHLAYSRFLHDLNKGLTKEAETVVSFWSQSDDIIGNESKAWGRVTSLIPHSNDKKVFEKLKHMEMKTETVPDQYAVLNDEVDFFE